MTAHTPWPWHSVGLTIRDRDARTIARMEYRYPEVANDARLIAAAPELLEALKEMVDYSQSRQANTSERKMLAEIMARLGEKHRPLLARLGASPFVEEGD